MPNEIDKGKKKNQNPPDPPKCSQWLQRCRRRCPVSQLCLNLEEFWDALAVAAGRFHPNLKKKINKKKKVKEKNTHTHTEREKDAKAFFPPTGKERRRNRERGNKE